MNDYSSVFVILMGLGTVFFGLICLIVLTTVMGKVITAMTPQKAVATVDPDMPTSPIRFSAGEPRRQELAAAVGAVVAEELGVSVTGIRILSIKKL